MAQLKLVSLNGSPRARSRTDVVVGALATAIRDAVGADWQHFRLAEIGPVLLPALMRDQVSPDGELILQAIEAADIIVVGTPVYRASYTGILKHVFDLVHYDALRGRIAVLAATGGNRHHGLMTEHQLRPLLSFFGAITVPTTIYAEEADFSGDEIISATIRARILAATRDVQRLASATTPGLALARKIEEVEP